MVRDVWPEMQSKIISYPFKQFNSTENCVLVGGCFDLLHYGHLTFLKAARSEGDSLVVALEPDTTISRSKGSPPIHTQYQRAQILGELRCVDTVVMLPQLSTFEDYLQLVQTIKPAILAITEGDSQTENKQKQAKSIGAKIVVVNHLIEGLSSSLIKLKHL